MRDINKKVSEKNNIKNHFNFYAADREKWLQKSKYFHSEDLLLFKDLIPPESKVLEIGCGNGNLIGNLNIHKAIGIDISNKLIDCAKQKYSHCEFHYCPIEDIQSFFKKTERFDFIIISDTIGYFKDVQKNLNLLHQFCSKDTRIIISYFSALWSPILSLAIMLKLKMPDLNPPLFSNLDLQSFLSISGFETIKIEKKIILPIKLFGVEKFLNRIVANLPLINHLSLRQYVIARSLKFKNDENKLDSASIVIPCKNESGNVEKCLKRIPTFCEKIEVIFVEGGSTDKTWDKINELISSKKYNSKFKLKAFKQYGKGKKNAVLTGFEEAENKVLIILDCDMTVPPENLDKFWEIIVNNKAEFVNGTRLIYPMKKNAMQFLNYIANKTFSHLFSWILGQRFTDTLCGTKVISKSNFKRLKKISQEFNKLDPFGDFYLIFGASKLSLKIEEVPVRYFAREYGETQISRFKDGYQLLKMIFSAFLRFKIISFK